MESKQPKVKKADILCFRHAKSEFNEGEESFYKHDPHKNYQHFQSQATFADQVLYNPKYIDASLSAFGLQQCEKARQNPQIKLVKVVLVSPLKRAMQTANIVFGGLGIPIIVRPELTESFRYSCDLSCPMEEKKKLFPNFDYQYVSGFAQHWEITKILSQRNQKKFEQFLQKYKHLSYAEQQVKICSMVGSKELGESDQELRMRANSIKEMLRKYREEYESVAIVSHWWVITFLLGEGYDYSSFPLGSPDIVNAKPYWTSLAKLLLHK